MAKRITSERAALLLLALSAVACTTVGRITNLDQPPCGETFRQALASVLVAEGESREEAERLADQTSNPRFLFAYGPRAFLVSSHSGADYTFFVQKKKEKCLLRLVERQKGFIRYTNDITYIATRSLPACQCSE